MKSENRIEKSQKLLSEAWEQVKDHDTENHQFFVSSDYEYTASKNLLKEWLPKFWIDLDKYDKAVNFIKKEIRCDDETYNCLGIQKIVQLLAKLYSANKYEEALKVFEALLNKSNDDFVNAMIDVSVKRSSYFNK